MSEVNISTGPCRFCGQVVQLDETERTEEQIIEDATLRCSCVSAIQYRKEKKRKERALKNVEALFGSEHDNALKILNMTAEAICNDEIEKMTLYLYNGTKATISQNSKGEINVERTVTKKQKLTE